MCDAMVKRLAETSIDLLLRFASVAQSANEAQLEHQAATDKRAQGELNAVPSNCDDLPTEASVRLGWAIA
jgi:hypothetical protein